MQKRKQQIKDIQKYANKWVAIDQSKTKVIAGGKSFNEVWKKLSNKSKDAIFFRVPPSDAAYVP